MFGLSWLKIAAGAVIAVIVVIAVLWVLQPVFAQRANEKAAAKVTGTIAAAAPKVAEATVKVETKSNTKVGKLNEKSKARVARIVAAPDPDAEWYAGMCERERYAGDPECSRAGSAGGKANTPGHGAGGV